MTNASDATIGRWIGDVRGTHAGTAFLSVSRQGDGLIADLRVNVGGNVAVFDGVIGPDRPVTFEITARELPGGEAGANGVTGRMVVQGSGAGVFSTSWELSDGAMGVADWRSWTPVQETAPPAAGSLTSQPVQLVSKDVRIGAVTIYRSEFEGLIDRLRQLFQGVQEPVVTATVDKSQRSLFARDLFTRTDIPSALNDCTVSVLSQGPNERRSVVINLRKHDDNNIVVQALEETWATGVSVDLAEFMNRYASFGTGWFRKYGLSVNGLLLIFALVVVPDLGLLQRALFFAVIIVIMLGFRRMHALVPNTVLYLDQTRRNPLRRQWPTIFSTIVAGVIVFALSKLFDFLSKTNLATFLGGN